MIGPGSQRDRQTHHTQFDTYDAIVPEYQKHTSIVIAIGARGIANLDELLPRQPVPATRPRNR